MPILRTDIPMTPRLCEDTILALTREYPFCRSEVLTTTAFGRPVRTLVIGSGPRKVIYTAAHHANEWITTPVILKFVEELAEAIRSGGRLFGTDARALAEKVTIYTGILDTHLVAGCHLTLEHLLTSLAHLDTRSVLAIHTMLYLTACEEALRTAGEAHHHGIVAFAQSLDGDTQMLGSLQGYVVLAIEGRVTF